MDKTLYPKNPLNLHTWYDIDNVINIIAYIHSRFTRYSLHHITGIGVEIFMQTLNPNKVS